MDWKEKLNSLYDSLPKSEEIVEPDGRDAACHVSTVANKPQKQTLRVELDKRKGKSATLITEFEGSDAELKELARQLKIACGVGGSARGGEILIQGDFRTKATSLLEEMGYKIKKR